MNVLDMKTSDRHCLFRAAGATFAVSALSVCEIAECPPLVAVPHAPRVLAGLCHFRNEFVPVLNIEYFLGRSPADARSADYLLVLSGHEGRWALLVDRGLSLEPLEIAYAAAGSAANVLVGTASYRDEIVQVLDADLLYQQAVMLLEDDWKTAAQDRVSAVGSAEADREALVN